MKDTNLIDKLFSYFLTSTLLIITFILLSCGNRSFKVDGQNAYKNASISQETGKRFMAVKIISLQNNLSNIDAFGDSLKLGQWYLRCNATGIIFPIRSRNSIDRFNIGNDELNVLAYPLSPQKYKKEEGEVLIKTGDILGNFIKVEILLLGPDQVTINDYYKEQEVWLK